MRQMLAVQTTKSAGFDNKINALPAFSGADCTPGKRLVSALRINSLRDASKRVALAACVALAGCGGGSPEPVKPACTPIAGPVRIALFGDSTMYGTDGGNVDQIVGDRPVQILQRTLDARFGAGVAQVIDRSVGGTDVGQLLAGTDGLNAPWPQPLVDLKPQIMVINHAINSMNRLVPVATYAAQLRAIATQAASVQVMLQTPNPMSLQAPYGLQWRVDTLPGYVTAMRQLAAELGLGVIEVNGYDMALPGIGPMVGDGVHPTQELYRLQTVNVMAPAVGERVRVLKCLM